jgi:predicted GIY-YIG superfamily endonuclease
MGSRPDYARLASEVLGIRNAPDDLARRLVSQALVVEDRAEKWEAIGERICREAPAAPGVYVLRDADDRVLYVGKAINLRRRLRTHFSRRRWKGLKAGFARACQAEWTEAGSELEALLREAALIAELQPSVNVQQGAPALETRTLPAAIARDVLVIVPSVEPDAVELIGARTDGGWMIQRTARNGADLVVHVPRVTKFFSPLRRGLEGALLAPSVFSWLAGRGQAATRLDPHTTPRALRASLTALLKDRDLFEDRIIQKPPEP